MIKCGRGFVAEVKKLHGHVSENDNGVWSAIDVACGRSQVLGRLLNRWRATRPTEVGK